MKKPVSPQSAAVIDPVADPTPPTAGFTISPSTFPPGQSFSALVCLSPLNTAGLLTFDLNDVIGFTFDSSFGTVTSIDTPILVHSSTLTSSDFTAHLGAANPNKITITYITAISKPFEYTDIICAKVTFTTSNTVGSTLLKYSSKFTGQAGVVPNLPYLTTSVVEFPIGPPAAPGVALNPLQIATLQWQPANETGLDFTVGSNATAIAFTPKVFSKASPGFPTLGNCQAASSNSEGVAEDFTNSFGVPNLLNRPGPQGRKPWATIGEHLWC